MRVGEPGDHQMAAELRTDRLLLRQWRAEDRAPFAAMNADPVVMEHFPAPLTADESNALVDRIQRRFEQYGWGLWAVEVLHTGSFAGFVGLAEAEFTAHFTPAVEVGWRLDPRYWNHGYATEAARAALEYGFGRLALDEIVSFTAVGNTRSRRVIERLGMTHDPRDDFDHPNLPPGHRLRRHALYRIARDQPAAPGHQASPEHQAAGDFASWVVGMQGALRGEAGSDVPCGSCTACCTASQFVHIGPDETDTLLHIPHALLFPAPRMPRGHVLLGYDERGHCPMLIDDECSIYEHRPRTCRTYDCRVFPAAGLRAGEEDDDKALIDRQTERWRFTYPTADDRIRHDAVRAAAAYLDRHPEVFADGAAPTAATPRAVLAVEMHDVFFGHDAVTGAPTVVDPDPAVVRVELGRRSPE